MGHENIKSLALFLKELICRLQTLPRDRGTGLTVIRAVLLFGVGWVSSNQDFCSLCSGLQHRDRGGVVVPDRLDRDPFVSAHFPRYQPR